MSSGTIVSLPRQMVMDVYGSKSSDVMSLRAMSEPYINSGRHRLRMATRMTHGIKSCLPPRQLLLCLVPR